MAILDLQFRNMSLSNLPQMTTSTYASQVYDGTGNQTFGLGNAVGGGLVNLQAMKAINHQDVNNLMNIMKEEKVTKQSRRLIKVIIMDPDDKVPLNNCILYTGSEKLTDLTDQELFFELDIKNLLNTHNAERIKIVDKTVKERTENLEPIKVRDLRMVVVTVASF